MAGMAGRLLRNARQSVSPSLVTQSVGPAFSPSVQDQEGESCAPCLGIDASALLRSVLGPVTRTADRGRMSVSARLRAKQVTALSLLRRVAKCGSCSAFPVNHSSLS